VAVKKQMQERTLRQVGVNRVILLDKGEKFEREKYLFYDTCSTDGPKSL
jgi:hypothetical protein